MSSLIDLTGKTFGKLTVVKLASRNQSGEAVWHCECVCGEIRLVVGGNLRRGRMKSCGCAKRLHGKSRTRECCIWRTMLHRCCSVKNNSYAIYGGRGIGV